MAHPVDDFAGPAAETARTPAGPAALDTDGTLLPNTTAGRQTGPAAADMPTAEQLEHACRDQPIDSTRSAERRLQPWAHAGPGLCRHAFTACPRTGGPEDTPAWLRERPVLTCLLTTAPHPFAACFTGFDHVFASPYPHGILDPEDKPEIVRRLQRDPGLKERQIIALQDSGCDVPPFRTPSKTVAVNAWTTRGSRRPAPTTAMTSRTPCAACSP
ncbi:hypothetical protein A6A06_38610 [Streptomyces sp. CB02923]|uniref:hypothetical protein n=1 Tax=Streptomyces sp. CB02923 TaxID=1718985 RepID=UPI00093AE4A0|nr:hypothetical protein [Streptomyces sp. CB02923]OKI04016.1 hypothetical protein A6A06_38610 [Streptomyces sp. CB02923]